MKNKVGFIGAMLLVLMFIFNSFNFIMSTSIFYQLINLIGSLILSYVAVKDKIYHFVFINIIWSVASFVKLLILINQ